MKDWHGILSGDAIDANEEDSNFFIHVLAKSLTDGNANMIGLSRPELHALLQKYFVAEDTWQASLLQAAPVAVIRHDDFPKLLRRWLYEHSRRAGEPTQWIAAILAQACLRPHHLWQDLGLPGREAVTSLLKRHFTGVVEMNTQHWRWKKFLAYSMQTSYGLDIAPAPGCPACEAYTECYPPSETRLTPAAIPL